METLQQFITRFPSKVFAKGETILLKDDDPTAVLYIESGYVKTYSITAAGDERLVAINGKGQDFPLGYAFGVVERSSYFYDAFTKCTIRFLPREQYFQYIHSDIQILHDRHARLIRLLLGTLSRVEALEQPHASDKVVRALMYMADQVGVILRPYKKRLKVSVTQQEIANSLGLTRETTNVELKKLEMMKLITHTRKSYILSMERLRRYLDKDL
jgi:CRP-like cAMP-binding protein